MNVLDIVILAVAVWGLAKGWASGFFRQVVSISGFLVGLVVAFLLYATLGDWLAPRIGSDVSVGRALAFILLWIGVPAGLSFAAHLLTKAASTVKLGGLNHLGGALLGGLKYLVFLSCVLNVAAWLDVMPAQASAGSRLYHPVRAVSARMFHVCKAHVAGAVEDVASMAAKLNDERQPQ